MADLQTRLNALERPMRTVAGRPRCGDPAHARQAPGEVPRDPFEEES